MQNVEWEGFGSSKTRSKDYVAIHGANEGIFRCDVLKKPIGRKDFIVLTYNASKKGSKPRFMAVSDAEALMVARLLLWAVQERNKRISFTRMD